MSKTIQIIKSAKTNEFQCYINNAYVYCYEVSKVWIKSYTT
jgi:hypothetical protein